MAHLAYTYNAAVRHMYHADQLTAPFNAQIANAVDARADFGVGLATVNGAMLLVPDATTQPYPDYPEVYQHCVVNSPVIMLNATQLAVLETELTPVEQGKPIARFMVDAQTTSAERCTYIDVQFVLRDNALTYPVGQPLCLDTLQQALDHNPANVLRDTHGNALTGRYTVVTEIDNWAPDCSTTTYWLLPA